MLIPGKPARSVKTALATYFGGRARVVRDVPNAFQPGDTPIILIADDGGPLEWPVSSKNTIRITVFGTGISQVEDLCGEAVGELFSNPPAGLAHVYRKDSIATIVTRDPKTGADLASAAVPVRVRTTSV